MNFFSPFSIDHPAQIADLSKGFAAAAIQYITMAKQQDAGTFATVSNIVMGIGTGAAMTMTSLALLQIVGG